MDQVRVGASGLHLSAITLGCMSFGTPGAGLMKWSLGEEDSRAIIRVALEAGVTAFDTADMYSAGASEEITGRALRELANRDEIVVATKVYMPMHDGPHGRGLSRKHIMSAIDASLRRLGMDYVDLYQIHRYDTETPIEETMEALHDVVKAGKARYLGASSMWTWQFAQLQHAADLGGWTRFVTMQDHYNLLQREEEREMHPYCLDTGVGVIPWSPLARGRLTRPWGERTNREETDRLLTTGTYTQQQDADRLIVDAVGQIAAERGVSMAQVALAWVRRQPAITSPIVGATKLQHLTDAIAACDLVLTDEEAARLTAAYTPRLPEGF